MKTKATWLLMGLLLAVTRPAAAGTREGGRLRWKKSDPFVEQADAAETAEQFVAALAAGAVEKLLELGSDPFDFNGWRIGGREALRAHWRELIDRYYVTWRRLRRAQIETMLYSEAVKRFGPPPRKFRYLDLPHCHFAAVRLPGRPGLLLILKRDEAQNMRVAAVAE